MNDQSLIELFHNQKISCAFVLKREKGVIHCLTEDGKETKVAPDKVLSFEDFPGDCSGEKESITRCLKSIAVRRESIADEIDVAELWDVCNEETAELSLKDLCGLYFGSDCSQDRLRGMFRKLSRDKLYFKPGKITYAPQSREIVESQIQQKKKSDERRAKYEAAGLDFKAVLESRASELGPTGAEFIRHLEDVCIKKRESPKFQELSEIFKMAGISSRNAPFEILVRSGVWSEDENLLLRGFSLKKSFPDVIQENCRRFDSFNEAHYLEKGYSDLTGLSPITIDDEATRDIDDAISFDTIGGNSRIGVHIADITSFISRGSPIDEEAFARGTSIYMPDLKIEMIPCSLSEQNASLMEGEKRAALSFFATLDERGEILSSEIREGIIQVRKRMTYDEVDSLVGHDEMITRMHALADRLFMKRISKGSIYSPFPRMTVKVREDGEIFIRKDDPSRSSQVLVSESMILANYIAADFCVRNNLPAIYRGQPPPDEPLPVAGHIDPVVLYNMRRLLKKGTAATYPQRHSGLGLDRYMQVTSPLRRYSDLVMHRQIKHFIESGEVLYTEQALRNIIELTERSLEIAEILERDRKNYWLLKYLSMRKGRECRAIVLRLFHGKMLLQLQDTLLETDCAKPKGIEVSTGDLVTVAIELVWPRENTVRVSFQRKGS